MAATPATQQYYSSIPLSSQVSASYLGAGFKFSLRVSVHVSTSCVKGAYSLVFAFQDPSAPDGMTPAVVVVSGGPTILSTKANIWVADMCDSAGHQSQVKCAWNYDDID